MAARYVVQAAGAFGDFTGPQYFADLKPAHEWANTANSALKPEVPKFKVFELKALPDNCTGEFHCECTYHRGSRGGMSYERYMST